MPKKKKIVKMSPEQQLEALEKRYGTSLFWVDVTIAMTHQEVENYFGPKCKEYEPTCGCCKAWVEWQTQQQKVTVSLERNNIIKLLGEA